MAIIDANSNLIGDFNKNVGSTDILSPLIENRETVDVIAKEGERIRIPYSVSILPGESVYVVGSGVSVVGIPSNVITNTRDRTTTLDFVLDFGVITEANINNIRTLSITARIEQESEPEIVDEITVLEPSTRIREPISSTPDTPRETTPESEIEQTDQIGGFIIPDRFSTNTVSTSDADQSPTITVPPRPPSGGGGSTDEPDPDMTPLR